MSRPYTCAECHEARTTETKRGPVPKRCPACKPTDVRLDKRAGAVEKVRSDRVNRNPATLLQNAKVAQAIQLRMQYRTWSQIAGELGWNSGWSAAQAVLREQQRRRQEINEGLDEMRAREVERLEALGLAALQVLETKHYAVSNGSVVLRQDPVTQEITELLDDGPTLAAVNTLVKVSESFRKLLGLDAAQKVEAAVTVQYTIEGIPESEMP